MPYFYTHPLEGVGVPRLLREITRGLFGQIMSVTAMEVAITTISRRLQDERYQRVLEYFQGRGNDVRIRRIHASVSSSLTDYMYLGGVV